ncbi:MAG: hypothetical protein MJ075_00965 [Oscillospiraceae bacterium]|nr:hypothetical protein [Oscillospiraceae bacterium]
MAEADLKKLNRKDLLELLLQVTQENESLKDRLSASEDAVTELKSTLTRNEMELQDAQAREGLLRQELAEVTLSRDEAEAQLEGMTAEQEELEQKHQEKMDEVLRMASALENATDRIDAAEARLQNTIREQEQRLKRMEKAGSLAEACLSMDGLFTTAQESGNRYLRQLKDLKRRQQEAVEAQEAEGSRKAEQMLADTKARCDQMEKQTKMECATMRAKARDEADDYWRQLSDKMDEYSRANDGVRKLLSIFNIKTKRSGESV